MEADLDRNTLTAGIRRDYFMRVGAAINYFYKIVKLPLNFAVLVIEDQRIVYGVRPKPGIRVRAVKSYAKELSIHLQMWAEITLEPGKNYISISFSRKEFEEKMMAFVVSCIRRR